MKTWLRLLLILLIAIPLIIIVVGYMFSKPLPKEVISGDADEVARKILESINADKWNETKFVRWSFPRGHDYVWDRERDYVEVKWSDNRVLLHTKTLNGIAYADGNRAEGTKEAKLIEKAWTLFANDSWWLNAPAKVMDSEASRTLVKLDDGREGLKVSYESGGVTPGDSYVWLYDENFRPTSYKMWVSIIPIGGVESTWENWKQLESGAWIASDHKMSKVNLVLKNISSAESLEEFGLPGDLFKELSTI